MRTTVELPSELLRAAEAHAAARGETLKEFLTRAVAHELGEAVTPRSRRGKVRLPLIASDRPGRVDLANAEIDAIFAADDAERANH
ncbi:hypothetical protein B1813_03465 [Saccharomonospora piscinae]|uniref:Uncharacterized protein n=1 Tax=Saccharomonospora piscinae TaxID=687388 RepID=A0A1V9A904_SACPI|nr:hypothetical protein [Saccharomonospora piscinae]OQO93617.1 hypothetical protein B1813_03465 [Saccharomonospora piscinae]